MPVIAHSQCLLDLVAPDIPATPLGSRFLFSEGPVWNPIESTLYFNDIPGDVQYRWDATDGIVRSDVPTKTLTA